MTFEPIASPGKQDTAHLLAKLGTTLVESGAIDRRTLDRARRVASETGGRLDQVLTQLGLMSDRGLAEALAALIAAPDDRAPLARADPLDVFTRDAVAAALGRPVAIAVAIPVELEAALERLY